MVRSHRKGLDGVCRWGAVPASLLATQTPIPSLSGASLVIRRVRLGSLPVFGKGRDRPLVAAAVSRFSPTASTDGCRG